jgi:Flp pilus assembly protein TadD
MKFKILAVIVLMSLLHGCTGSDDNARLVEINRQIIAGQYASAVQSAEKYVAGYPDSYKGYSVLGWAYLKNDQPEKAEASFDRAISINENWDNAYVGKGVLFRQQGKLDLARQSYLKATSLVPDNAEAFSSLVVIELIEGNNAKAVEYGERAWALRKDYPSIPANLAIAYHYLGNMQKRDEFYQHAQRLGYHDLQAVKDIFSGKTGLR